MSEIMDRSAEIKAILQKACDRDWKDETLYQTAVIAANAIFWRGIRIKELEAKLDGRSIISNSTLSTKEK